eukprot:12657751-Heterocapsa_arctica.AAC.1
MLEQWALLWLRSLARLRCADCLAGGRHCCWRGQLTASRVIVWLGMMVRLPASASAPGCVIDGWRA